MKFLVDHPLGKLARELRLLGLDAEYARPDKPLAIFIQARSQGRVLLTRTRALRDRQGVYFVAAERLEDQVRAVLERFKLHLQLRPFTRCLRCNQELIPISKEEVRHRVPFFIFETQNHFQYCPGCDRIYWPGSHLKDMERRVQRVVSRET
jgi:hypothetical protein